MQARNVRIGMQQNKMYKKKLPLQETNKRKAKQSQTEDETTTRDIFVWKKKD